MGSARSAPAAWLVILGYTMQLYFDFSGYCDIAAGCARLLGLRLPINFDSPYRSLSVTEFWKRWHMTLTADRKTLFLGVCRSRFAASRLTREDTSSSPQPHQAAGVPLQR